MATLDLKGTTETDWLDALAKYQRSTIGELRASGQSLDDIIETWLSRTGPENTFAFGVGGKPDNMKNAVGAEVRKLICGDKKYDKLREQIASEWSKGKAAVVGTISAVIGASVGLAAGVLVPVIALFLAMVSQVGVNAWCALKES